MEPFYCPLDKRLYIDLDVFADMQRRFAVQGDFAFAYVIAHEVGHHVQNLLGILPKVQAQQRRASESEANVLSVRTELMADCLAGVWANQAETRFKVMEAGDLEEATNAASAGGGAVMPDSFTHGSSQQRVRRFRAGLKSGSIGACNTFDAQP